MNALDGEQGNEDRFGEVLAAYLEAVDADWAPDRRAFLARYPQWQRELEEFFASQDEVHSLAEPFRPLPRSLEPTVPQRSTFDPERTIVEGTDHASTEALPSFGDFELVQEIARGGMGVVYRAKQRSLNRMVAVKMILAGRFASAAEVQRFRNEAESTALLDHPGIVPIYEVGEHQGQRWFRMKLTAGGSLAERMPRFAADPRAAASLLVEVARAVHYAHQRGILHRDLKPGNILIDEHGRPVVTDFGLSKRVERDSGLTQSGAIMGTPSYMAPEQALGKQSGLTTGADTYSLGAILYGMLTGRPPFQADNPFDTLLQVRELSPVPPRTLNPKLDRDLESICLKCLEKEPLRRYGTAADLADDLGRWLDGKPIVCRPVGFTESVLKWMRRRPALALMAALAILVVVLGVFGLGELAQLNTANEAWQRESQHARNEGNLREQAVLAERQAVAARTQAEKQKELTELTLYVNRMIRAHFEWQNNRLVQADQLLDSCPERLRHWEWHYVKRLCHPEQLTFQGHTDGVSSVAFSPDGRRLASAGWDQTVRVWDARTGQQTLALKGHTDAVYSVIFSPDGRRLASAGEDKTVKVWDARTGQEAFALKGHNGFVHSVAFSPDGRLLASAGMDNERIGCATGIPVQPPPPNTVKLWDARTGEQRLLIKGHTGLVYSVAFSPDGRRLASAGTDRTVKLWDVQSGQEILTFKGHTDAVLSVSFSPDGKRLASGGSDQTVKVWDVQSGQQTLTLKGHTALVGSVAFSPDGKHLASSSEDQTVKVWNARTGQEALTLKGHTASVLSVAFSPDGKRLASASLDRTVRLWDIRTGPNPLTLKGHTQSISSVAFGPDGRRLTSAGDDGTVKLWDVQSGRDTLALKGHAASVWSVAFSPDGKRLASAGGDQTVKLWDVQSGREARLFRGHANPVLSVAFSPDGRLLASAGGDQTVKLWDVQSGREILTLKGHSTSVNSVAFSPDGKRLASASGDRTVKLWDAQSGREILTFKGHTSGVTSVAFSPDGNRLASGSDYLRVKVWESHTGREVFTLEAHTYLVYSVAFSPDGQRLASAGSDGTVKLWDMRTGQEVLALKGHTDTIRSVAFSPDGIHLASAGADGTVKVWDATPLAEGGKEAK